MLQGPASKNCQGEKEELFVVAYFPLNKHVTPMKSRRMVFSSLFEEGKSMFIAMHS